MKKCISLLLALSLLVSMLPACSGQTVPPAETTLSTTQPVQTEETQPTQPAAPADLTISEVMADNQKLCLGHSMDWVELYNREENPVQLDGYCLTNDPKKPDALPLSGMTVDAGDYLVVTLDKTAPFHLSAVGGSIYLTYYGRVLTQLDFGITTFGESFGADGVCPYPSPGYDNTEDGHLAYLQQQPLPELIISEALPRNSAYPVKGQYYDYVELKNNGDQPLELSQYAITDRWEQPSRFYLPQVTLQPGEYYVVYCSGDPSLGQNHAPFKLSSQGETLYLTKNSEYLDSLTIPSDLKNNESYGRDGKIPLYLKKPTPGKENTTGYRHGIGVPQASLASGMYEEAVTVSLSGEGTIYYTLDGSRPTTSSRVYKKPFNVTGLATIRCFCVSEGRSSDLTAYTYIVGKEHDLPVLTVTISQDKLTGTYGVLNHIDRNYEYESMMTLIEDGEEKFSIPMGFRLHGNDSRKGAKQNFQVRFRSKYGASLLNYPIFENRDFTEYHSLLLKGGSEDWSRAMMRDELATAIPDGTTHLYTQAIKPVALYLGGTYWGIYYIRERYNENYVASHLGVSPESATVIESSAGYVESGTRTEYTALLRYIRTHDMSKPEHYAYITQHVDIYSLMDWYICRSFMGDVDLANVRRFRSDEGDGKWRWMYYDLDWGWYNSGSPVSSILHMWGGDMALMRAVLKSKEGKETFLMRYSYLLETILNDTYINSTIDKLENAIRSEIPRDRARWNRSVSRWEQCVQELRNFDKNGKRRKVVLQNLKNYFGLSAAEMELYFGA